MILPGSQITFAGFGYKILDGQREVQGKEQEKEPIKILQFQNISASNDAPLIANFIFSLEEWETFKRETSGSRIVPASEVYRRNRFCPG